MTLLEILKLTNSDIQVYKEGNLYSAFMRGNSKGFLLCKDSLIFSNYLVNEIISIGCNCLVIVVKDIK